MGKCAVGKNVSLLNKEKVHKAETGILSCLLKLTKCNKIKNVFKDVDMGRPSLAHFHKIRQNLNVSKICTCRFRNDKV